jgi:hypothetical protein
MPLDDWQEAALEASMGERADGRWASKFVGISAPRQNGKSQLIVARALAGILLFGEKTILCSAHQTDTAREVFQRLLDVIEDNPSLALRVSAVMRAVNRESITFGTGAKAQIIKIKARAADGGRGFSSDCLLLDEAQILGKRQWASIVPTMSARPNPQLWLLGTPPTPENDAFAFSRMRESAMHGSARHAWLEWAADLTDDFDAPETWAKANPSYGVRISHEACADDRAAMDDEQFAMERLGIWVDPGSLLRALSPARWLELSDPDAERGTGPVFGVDVTQDREAWVAVAWQRPDGASQVMLANEGEPMPAFRVADYVKELSERWSGTVTGSGSLEDEMPHGFVSLTSADFTVASGRFADLMNAGTVRHGNQPALNLAVKAARWRSAGTGGERAFQLRDAPEVGPLAAAARALHVLTADIRPFVL